MAASLFCCFLLAAQIRALKLAASEHKAGEKKLEVWISSFPRSASSTVLSIVRASANDEDMFSLFEPCHKDDLMGPDGLDYRKDNGDYECPRVVHKLARCNFTGVDQLWGWSDDHTTNWDKTYSPEFASEACTNAKYRVIKTVGGCDHVDPDRLLENMQWVLNSRPDMKVLNLVRDPRSIYASWKSLPAFSSIIEARKSPEEVPLWRDMCDTFVANMKVNDPRVLTVVYEKLVKSPVSYVKHIYDFLGLTFGSDQQTWVETNFPKESTDCPNGGTWKYSDCQGQTNSFEEMEAWRGQLSTDEKQAFATYKPCQEVMKAFDFPEV